MKHLLNIHKLLWFLIVLFHTSIEIILIGIYYILYIIWNFKFPKSNLWLEAHSYRDTFSGKWIKDNNPWQTITRRYKHVNE